MHHLLAKIKELGLNQKVQTIDDFDLRCQNEGVLTFERPMRKWKGLYLVCDQVPCIVLNSHLSMRERPIVSFHELGHHYLHATSPKFYCQGIISKSEYEANIIAAVALLPTSLVERYKIEDIQNEFGYPGYLLWFRKRIYEQFGA